MIVNTDKVRFLREISKKRRKQVQDMIKCSIRKPNVVSELTVVVMRLDNNTFPFQQFLRQKKSVYLKSFSIIHISS